MQGQGHRGQGDGKAGVGQHYWQRWAGETATGQAEGPSGFHFSPLNCFPPCRAATPAAGDSGCRTTQCLGRSVGISERRFRLGPLSRGKAAAEGRAGTGPQGDGQGNLCDYVVPLAGNESRDVVRRCRAGKRNEGKRTPDPCTARLR